MVPWIVQIALAAVVADAPVPPPESPVAHYGSQAGIGPVVKDESGHGHSGTNHGAERLQSPRGSALAFRTGGYVDCGAELGRKLTGDMTIAAWIRLAPPAYPDGSTNWTIADCEDYTRSGFIFRVDGQTAKLYYRASSSGGIPGAFSKATIQKELWHHVAVARAGTRVTLFIDGVPDTTFSAERPERPSRPLTVSSPGQPFQGIIADLAFYDRALARDEILGRYKAEAAAYGKDTSWFGKFRLEPFFYLDRGKATVAVDFRGVLPLSTGTTAAIELGKPDGQVVQAIVAKTIDESGKQDFTFDLAGLAPGDYEVRAVLRGVQGKTTTRQAIPLRYPPAPVRVPAPAETTVAALSDPRKPLPFEVKIGVDGGFSIEAKGQRFPIVSEFSYPGGGFNALGQSSRPDHRPEEAWKPAVECSSPTEHRITAAGKHYALSRTIEVQPSRVVVRDTISNKTAEPLGILVRNTVASVRSTFSENYAAGYRSAGPVVAKPIKTNSTLFLSGRGLSLGLAALDDVFIVQSLATAQGDWATLHTDTFALDKGASYTLEWAIYPAASGDYYDFINQVRRDEGRNGSVDGGLGFISRGPGDRRGVPAKEDVELRSLKYGIIHCLSYAADDPGVSIEGIEFIDFPKERRLLKEQIAAIRRAYPGMKITFHVAHSLYATNKPEAVFPDSRVIDANGRHAVYTANPGPYFSKERFAQGWNWHIYYPTLDNSFGRAMLRSVDVMMDEIGADGPFMDGFMWAYGGEFTFDRWDGHTAQIDPKTKTITRKMGSVLLLSQDALVAFCRKVRSKGGVVIANNSVITRTIGREGYILHDRECFAGPEVHLAPTPLALSLPSAIRSEPDIHRDVLDKLAWGNLYIYYEECKLTHPSVPARMYPITFEEIRAGYVKGKERLIASRPGVYGWQADRDLHFAWLFDARGVQVPHPFLTTVDSAGVRTDVHLAEGQCAVVRKIPLRIESTGPVNVRVSKYDEQGCELVANGRGPVTLRIQSGDFPIRATASYVVGRNGAKTLVVIADRPLLSFPVELDGETRISIKPQTK